ncbi:ABC-type transport auxiliary lipoprotein family protein [Variovorax robiniae]|uniref:ABC-type transport auxiliary lipoprotein family protein n=1 Tax=Variovorax robiniae TaxID=1836199 RepID=A0ABU8XCT7_9BURK
MRNRHRGISPALCAIALAFAGCATTSPPLLLTLPRMDVAMAAPAPPMAPPRVLAVRRIVMPEYLLARRVRYRADDSTLAEWPDAYWSERIEVAVTRELHDALRRHLPGWTLCETSCGERSPAYALEVRWDRMDLVRSERRLDARARLLLWSDDRPPRLVSAEERAWSIPVDADTPQSHARAITMLLDRVATEAARALASQSPPARK